MALSNTTSADEIRQRAAERMGLTLQSEVRAPGTTPSEEIRSRAARRMFGLTLNERRQPESEDEGPGLLKAVEGRFLETALQAASSFAFLPRAAEFGAGALAGRAGLDMPEPIKAFQERAQLSEEIVREVYGFEDPSIAADIIGSIIGGVAGGFGGITSIGGSKSLAVKVFGQRLGPKVHRFMDLNDTILKARTSGKLAASAENAAKLAGEGALFELSMQEDPEAKDLVLGSMIGLAGGGLFSLAALRQGSKIRKSLALDPDLPEAAVRGILDDLLDVPPRFSRFLGQQDANDELVRAAAVFERDLDDQVVASVALSLQEAGEKGAIGSVRGMELPDEDLLRLTEAFPDYRFSTIDEPEVGTTLLYGLKPGLREGDEIGFLTDNAIDFYRRNGFMLGQRAQVAGSEVEVVSFAGRNQLRVRDPINPQTSWKVPKDEVMFLDDVRPAIGTGELFARFSRFQDDFGGSWSEAFDEFTAGLPGFKTGLKPSLRKFFAQREAATINRRLRPDARADLARFEAAQAKLRRGGRVESFEDSAAARGFVVHRLNDGRVKLTRRTDGVTRTFDGQKRANEYLQDYRVDEAIDLTPDMGEVPAEVFRGTVRAGAPANPSIPPDFEGRAMQSIFERPEKGRFREFFFRRPLRLVQLAEERGKEFEELVGSPIWTEGMKDVAEGATRAMNRSAGLMERIRQILPKVKPERHDVVDGWLRSELKETFEQANNMTKGEIDAARRLRKVFNDFFDDLSESEGITLSADDWFRNYSPDIEEYIRTSGSIDRFEQLWKRRGQELPDEVRFFGEMYKTGEFIAGDNIFARAAKAVRAGYFKSEVGSSYEQAVQFAKTIDDPDAQEFLVEWLQGQRGIPGAGRAELTRWVKEFFDSVGAGVSTQQGGTIVDDLWALNAGALIGFRPGLIQRNLTQNMQLLAPLLPNGFRRVGSAMVKASRKANREWAESIGAVRKQVPLSRSEIVEAIPEGLSREAAEGLLGKVKVAASRRATAVRQRLQRITRAGLKPYSSSDEYNRAIAAIAVRDGLDGTRSAWEAGEVTLQELARQGGLQFQTGPVQAEFTRLLNDEGFEAARNFAAREMANLTHFLYGAKNSAEWVRTGKGKMFGNYSTWPFGYINWVRRIGQAPDLSSKASALFKHGLVNAVLYGAKGFRINLVSWIPFGAAFYTGGPFTQAVIDAWTVANGGAMVARGYEPQPDFDIALNRLKDSWRLVVPGSVLFTSEVRRAANRLEEDTPGLAVLEAIGIRTEDPEPVGF